MGKWITKAAALAFILIALGYVYGQVQAAKGLPGSSEFGYGAALYTDSPVLLDDSFQLTTDLNPDWLYVPVSWAATFPQQDQPQVDKLDRVMAFAASRQIPVALSVTNAPSWAQTSKGPDASQAARFVLYLVQRYPQQVQAVELFPRANTRLGWGSPANPAAYASLYSAVDGSLRNAGSQAALVAAGLQPLPPQPAEGDMNDLVYLQALYAAGAKNMMPVISIQYVQLTGDPLTPPSEYEYRLLRHYEQVRRVMTANQHQNGLLWVTHLNLPDGSINPSDASLKDLSKQAEWLTQAAVQLRGQLYVGTVILQSVNPNAGHSVAPVSMVQSDGSLHPFYSPLWDLVKQNREEQADKPGKAKSGSLIKGRK